MADIGAPPPGLDDFVASISGAPPTAQVEASAPPEGLDDYVRDLGVQQHQEALQAKYGTGVEQAKAGLEAASRGLLGSSITSGLELAAGVKPEAIRGREEANPVTAGVAETGTFLGSALLGTGEAAVLSKAGQAAEVASGIQKGGRLASIGSGALRGAMEGALYQADKELHRKFVEDPSQTADNVFINMGATTLLGGIFGGATGALFRQAADEAKQVAPFISELDKPAVEAGDLAANVKASTAFKPAQKQTIADALRLGAKKESAPAIEKAAKDEGLPVLPGMTSADPKVEMAIDTLNNSPYTPAGMNIRKTWDGAYQAADNSLQSTVNAAEGQSKAELGQSLKESLTKNLRRRYEPIKQVYEEIGSTQSLVPLEEGAGQSLAAELKEIPEFRVSPSSPQGALVRQVLKDIDNVKTLSDLKILKDGIDVGAMATGSERRMATILRDKLTTMEEGAMESYAKSFPVGDEAGTYVKSLIDQKRAITPEYKSFIGKVGELSEQLGKGKVHGVEDALRFMNELEPEKVASRLFSKNDSEFMKFFSREFPEQFAQVKNYQRAEMFEKAMIPDSGFSAKKFFNNYNKMEPEAQKLLYTNEERKRIGNIETYLREGFPKNFNPSGTSHIEAFREAASGPLHYGKAVIRDTILEKLINSSEGKQVQQLSAALIKGERTMKSAIKSVFDSAKKMPDGVIPLAASRVKLDKLASEAAKDPSKLIAMNDNNEGVPEFNAPMAATASRVVNYLASIKPQTTPGAPLDSKRTLSADEKSNYDRALDIAQQPLVVLHHIRSGRITPQDLMALQSMYPSLYKQLRNSMVTGLAEAKDKGIAIPYKTRMGLSMFLGQPLDSTLTPMGILSAQPKDGGASRQPAMGSATQAPPASSMKGMDKLPNQYRTPAQAREQRSIKH